MSHTPGPWEVDDRRPHGELQIQTHHRGETSSYCVATVNTWESPAPNAALIAAAPEMLEMLKELRDAIRNGWEIHGPRIDAVIAKAEIA